MRGSALVAEVGDHSLYARCQLLLNLLQPAVCEGWGFDSKPQSGPDSEEQALNLGWGIRWAEGLCWYIQGDLKM